MADEIALHAPWTQKHELAPVYDANGKLVSFTQHAPQVVQAVNFRHFARPLMARAVEIIERATGPSACAGDTDALRLVAVQMKQVMSAISQAAE